MGFLGPAPQFGHLAYQPLTPNSSTTSFVLDYPVPNAQSMMINYGGVIQQPNVAFTTDGTNVDFTFTPTADTVLYIIFLGNTLSVPTPGADSVDEAALQDEVASPILLATSTASASATIDFDSGIDFTAYDEYKVVWSGVQPVTDNVVFRLRLSDDGGSTYEADASDYSVSGNGNQGGSEVNDATTGDTASLLTGATVNQGNAAAETTSGFIHIYSMNDSAVNTSFEGKTQWVSTAGAISNTSFAGMINATAVTNGIRLYFSSGNISIGEFKLYGLR